MDTELINEEEVNSIFENIKELVINSRNKVYQRINIEMLNLYWNIGSTIVQIQGGVERASYGGLILEKLSNKLTKEFGKGFSIQNLRRMRNLYLCFPIRSTLLSELDRCLK